VKILQILLPIANIEFNVLILIGIGFAVGTLGGFFGMGGGWIIAPALNTFGFPVPLAIGTGLANVSGQSIIATLKHRKMGNVDYLLGIVTGVFMISGVELGARVVMWLESIGLAGPVIRYLYIVLLASLGAYMLYDYYSNAETRAVETKGSSESPSMTRNRDVRGLNPRTTKFLNIPPVIHLETCQIKISLWVIAGVGLLIGVVSGITGAGGGFALVPAFLYLFGAPTVSAIGPRRLCVTISGAYGTFTYGLKGRVEPIAAILMLLGSAIGAQLGASATKYVRGDRIKGLYSLMLLLAASGVFLKQLGLSIIASFVILGGALLVCFIIIIRMVSELAAQR